MGIRASDHDREAALELLSAAASDGRVTLEEYSTRADQALAARMLSELSELTADLQQPVPPASGEIEAVDGDPQQRVALGTLARCRRD